MDLAWFEMFEHPVSASEKNDTCTGLLVWLLDFRLHLFSLFLSLQGQRQKAKAIEAIAYSDCF